MIQLQPKQAIIAVYIVALCNQIDLLFKYAHTNFQSVANSNHYIFQWIDPSVDINSWLSFVNPLTMILLIGTFPLLEFQKTRILWAFTFYLIEGFQFTYSLGHESHALVWISFFLALLPGRLSQYNDNHITLQTFIRLCQLQLFTIYGLAGVWKILGFIESHFDNNIASGFDYLQYAMSSEFTYSNKIFISAAWVSDHPLLCATLSAMVLLVQAGSTIVAFFPRYYFLWGLILASFHVGTLFTVNVFFFWSVPPIMILLCLCPMPKVGFKPLRYSLFN